MAKAKAKLKKNAPVENAVKAEEKMEAAQAQAENKKAEPKKPKAKKLKGVQIDLLPPAEMQREQRSCEYCGKSGATMYSGLHQKHYCSERCIELAMKNTKGNTEATIKVKASGEAYFEQGDTRFPVDAKNLNAVVDGNHEGTPIDKLLDSQIVTFAQANGLPVSPFSRELLRPVLIGILQMTWYRDLDKREISEHLKDNQRNRITWYLRALADYKKEEEKPASEKKEKAAKAINGNGAPKKAASTNVLTANIILKKMPKEGDLPKQAYITMQILKEKGGKCSLADLQNAMADGRIESKQPMSKIWAFYRNRFLGDGLIAVE